MTFWLLQKLHCYRGGENLYISFEIRGDETIMELCSVTVFQIYAWGKNEENLDNLLAELEDSLII
jgi:hypothetical protein